jgi:hypothetical protein
MTLKEWISLLAHTKATVTYGTCPINSEWDDQYPSSAFVDTTDTDTIWKVGYEDSIHCIGGPYDYNDFIATFTKTSETTASCSVTREQAFDTRVIVNGAILFNYDETGTKTVTISQKPPTGPTIFTSIEEIEVPDLPFYLDWVEPILKGFFAIFKAVANPFIQFFNFVVGLGNTIATFLFDALKFLLDIRSIPDKIHSWFMGKAYESISTHSPDWVADTLNATGKMLETANPMKPLEDNLQLLEKTPPTTDSVAADSTKLYTELTKVMTDLMTMDNLITGATLGQVNSFGRSADRLLKMTSADDLAHDIARLPFDIGLMEKLKQRYNYDFTPFIPAYMDLIEMVVKEVIPLSTFKDAMKYLGFSDTWSQRIWDKHFIAPDRIELNRAFWRGKINETALKRLQVIVDLDMRYRSIDAESGDISGTSERYGGGAYDIWSDLIYHDPSFGELREMYIFGRDLVGPQLDTLIRQTGIRPDWIEIYKNWVRRQQSYFFRRRIPTYLTGVYAKGFITSSELAETLKGYGFDESVAEEITRLGDLKSKYDVRLKPSAGEKRLSLSVFERMYKTGLITLSELKNEFATAGIDAAQTDLVVKMLTMEMIESNKARELPASIIKDSYFSGQMTEPDAVNRLALMGYAHDDIKFILARPVLPLPIGVLKTAFVTGQISEGTTIDELKLIGFDETRARIIVEQWRK